MTEDSCSEKKPKVRLSRKKKIIYSAISAILFFLVLEAAARLAEIWVGPREVDYGLGFDAESRLFVPSPTAPGIMVVRENKRSHFQVQEFSLKKAPGTLRIVIMGGSSVYLLEEELPVLKKNLSDSLADRYDNVEIINAGGMAYGSLRLAILIKELLEYAPDMILIYSGHNELYELEDRERVSLRLFGTQKLISRFALVRFVRDRIIDLYAAKLRRERKKGSRSDEEPTFGCWTAHIPEDIERRMKGFRDNLSFIIDQCKRQNVAVIIGSVPSNLMLMVKTIGNREAGLLYEQGKYDQALLLARRFLAQCRLRNQSSDVENGIIRSLAKEYNLPLADVEAAVEEAEPHHIPGETLFFDHCHLNAEGNTILRQTYEKVIIDLLK